MFWKSNTTGKHFLLEFGRKGRGGENLNKIRNICSYLAVALDAFFGSVETVRRASPPTAPVLTKYERGQEIHLEMLSRADTAENSGDVDEWMIRSAILEKVRR